MSHLVKFRAQDGLTVDISEATVVTLHMFKWFNNALRPKLQKLKTGFRVVANDFDIDEWKRTQIEYLTPRKKDTPDYVEYRTLYIMESRRNLLRSINSVDSRLRQGDARSLGDRRDHDRWQE